MHSNGYSLVRHVFFDIAGWTLDREVRELGRSLGEELLEPTRIYAHLCMSLADAVDVHAYAHVTGGGLAANLARVLPPNVDAALDRSTWRPQPIFGLVGDVGQIAQDELERTLNMGVGMVAILAPDAADQAVALLSDHGVDAWVVGEVRTGGGSVRLQSSYAA